MAENELYYSETGVITEAKNVKGDLIIPNKVPHSLSTPVTKIGDEAFRCCKELTSVVIPDSVTEIGESAFAGCSALTSVVIPDSVTTFRRATFAGCSALTSVVIPDSVTRIGAWTFSGCSGLQTIDITKSVADIDNSIFSGCQNIKWFKASPENERYTVIDGVLYNKSKSRICCYPRARTEPFIIPYSVTEVGAHAFAGCSALTSVVIPDSVTEIKEDAFDDCRGLTSVTIPDSITKIGPGAFAGCSALTSVVIPDSVTEIEEAAFHSCRGLTSVTIPDSITKIGPGAFFYCSGLNSVVIPDSVTEIDDDAFSFCLGLTSVTIPDSITEIRSGAFSDCSSLTLVKSEITEPFAIDCVFDDTVMARATLYVPAGTASKYRATEGWKEFANIVEDSEVVKQPDPSLETSTQTSVAITIEPVSISNSSKNDQVVETNIAKYHEVSVSSEQDSPVNSEASEQEATSDIPEPQMDDKKYFSKILDFGEYGTVEFVDLGLSSGTLWSTRNLGAQHVYDPGYEATWGDEIEVLPTYEQCEELIKECNFAVALLQEGNNTFGCVSVTGPNGNVIYLPLLDSEEFGCLAFDCWTRSDFGGSMGAFMLIQTEPLFGPFFNLSNITIGGSQKSVYRRWRLVTSR